MTNIVLLGEAYGEVEERERMAFVGPTGWELNKMLKEVGINRHECFLTNVFNRRPPGNKIEAFCGPKETAIHGYPALIKGGYVHKALAEELNRLAEELSQVNPNIIVALGNTAMWALLGKTSISKLRGSTQLSTHTITGFKVLPTYHPAVIFRQWSLRHTTVIDLMKAKRESLFPDVRRPERTIWIEPTLEDIHAFDEAHIKTCEILAVDIETIDRFITCIGFAPRPDLAIVIPFVIPGRTNGAYWPSVGVERTVWTIVKKILGRPTPKVFQNGLYDIRFLWEIYGIRVMGAEHDTMLLHHALHPEALKNLGYLGSLYTDEGSWKQMRESKTKTTIKRED